MQVLFPPPPIHPINWNFSTTRNKIPHLINNRSFNKFCEELVAKLPSPLQRTINLTIVWTEEQRKKLALFPHEEVHPGIRSRQMPLRGRSTKRKRWSRFQLILALPHQKIRTNKSKTENELKQKADLQNNPFFQSRSTFNPFSTYKKQFPAHTVPRILCHRRMNFFTSYFRR